MTQTQINPLNLLKNKTFINSQLMYIRPVAWNVMSRSEIMSDLNLAIIDCCRKYDPSKGKMFNYVQAAFRNILNASINNRLFFLNSEVELSYASEISYSEQEPDDVGLHTYIASLPEELITDLQQLVLGKIKKDDLQSNPSYRKMNIDRILEKLDGII
jgi:hypothetical protein